MSSNTIKYDDPTGFVQPTQDGRTAVGYPFLANGDKATKTYTRNCLQLESYYYPAVLGVEKDSYWSGGDPAAYLISETPPEPTGIGELMRFSRTYSRIPSQQTVYGSRMIDRPVMHDIVASGSYAVSFDNGVTSHVFTARKTASLSGTPDVPATAPLATAASLPVVTVTVGKVAGGTTTFSTSDSGSTIQSTLAAALGSSIYVAKSDTTISAVGASLGTTVKYVDVSGAGVTADYTTDSTTGEIRIGVSNQNSDSVRTVSSTAHGGAAGDLMAAWNGDKLTFTGKVISVTADALTVQLDAAPGKDDVVTHVQFADTSSTRYVNGAANCTVKEVTDFYLPGVSSGISTPADIALVAPKLDPVSWLTAIQAATAYVVCEGSQMERWLGGPIYSQTTTSVQMSDALDTVAVGA